jgi:DNA-directed RNA polymerase subunit H
LFRISGYEVWARSSVRQSTGLLFERKDTRWSRVQIPPSPFCPGGNCLKEKEITGRDFDPSEHKLVPNHMILGEEDLKKVLIEYNIEREQLPKIRVSDPAAIAIKAKVGDVVRIIRKSSTAGKSDFYRLVIA